MKVMQIYSAQRDFQSPKADNNQDNGFVQKFGGSKALTLSLAALAAISFAGVAISKAQPVEAQTATQKNRSVNTLNNESYNNFRIDDGNIAVSFVPPTSATLNLNSMQEPFNQALKKLDSSKKTDSHYSWVDLPSQLIQQKYVKSVYNTVNEFKKPFGSDSKLIFVALGNPSNTDELVNSMGLSANLVYACDLTPVQMKDSIKKAGGDLGKIQVIISSKSGSTFESNQTYKMLVDEFTQYYAKKGVKPENIQHEISKHFLFITDKNPEKSKLKKLAQEQGIMTIDAVDGLHSGFGDIAYSLPVLAYAGLSEDSADKMLKAADKMSKELQTKPLNQNMAGEMAAFDKLAEEKGATKEQFVFHDAHFTDFSMLIQQLYKESLRKTNFTTSVYPRGAHAGLESDVSSELNSGQKSIITNIYVRNVGNPHSNEEKQLIDSSKNLDIAHEISIKNEGHFQKNIELNLGEEGLTPEAVGEFVTLKSFVAYFKNEFETSGKNNMYEQDYVKGYKKIRENLELGNK